MTPNEAGPKSFAKIANNIDTFTKGSAAGVANQMFSDPERAALARFGQIMRSAGTTSPEQVAKQVGAFRSAFGFVAPSIATGLVSALGYVHPIVASLLASGMAAVQTKRSIANLPYKQTKLANMPLKAMNTPSKFSQRVLPAAALAGYQGQATGGRIGRKTGGVVRKDAKAEAHRLIALSEKIRKKQAQQTEPLLNLDDTTVAKALEIANRGT